MGRRLDEPKWRAKADRCLRVGGDGSRTRIERHESQYLPPIDPYLRIPGLDPVHQLAKALGMCRLIGTEQAHFFPITGNAFASPSANRLTSKDVKVGKFKVAFVHPA
jgi:hypothetical protein